MATRKAISNKFYATADGARSNSPTPEAVIVGFEFFTGEKDSNGKNIVRSTQLLDTRELSEEHRHMAMLHGYAQKTGDEWSGKGDEAEEICLNMFERYKAGEWNMARGAGSGPLPSMVIEAVLAVLAANGVDVNDSVQADVTAALGEDGARKSALADPKINAEYQRLRAEAAMARAAKAAQAAESSDDSDGGFLAAFG